jgi:hypothetical protein
MRRIGLPMLIGTASIPTYTVDNGFRAAIRIMGDNALHSGYRFGKPCLSEAMIGVAVETSVGTLKGDIDNP